MPLLLTRIPPTDTSGSNIKIVSTSNYICIDTHIHTHVYLILPIMIIRHNVLMSCFETRPLYNAMPHYDQQPHDIKIK